MRKNQKYNKEEMYLSIELWQESGLSQTRFCTQEKISVKSFSYWLRKYKNEKGLSGSFSAGRNTPGTFIPAEVSDPGLTPNKVAGAECIEIVFPNGVQLSCPVGIDIGQLKSLINY